MNLRTVTFWALYDPENKRVVEQRSLKREIERVRLIYADRLVVVKFKGNYVRQRKGGVS